MEWKVPGCCRTAGMRAADLELIERARTGDEGAFRALVERYEAQVAATAIGMLGPGLDAEEVGQDTFVRFHQSLDRFRGESSLGTYLTRIAINLSLNAARGRQRARARFWSRDRPDDPPPEPAVDGRETVEREELQARVRQAIQQLKPDHRAVVVLRMVEGYSTRETAELLGVPEGTVFSRLSRGLASLKSALAPRMPDDGP